MNSQNNPISETENPTFKFIATNKIPATESKTLAFWMMYVLFAYHYKVIVCGFFGKTMGYDWLCETLVHGVTTNHWFEQLIYVPILWFAFYKITEIVFGPAENEILSKKVRRLKFWAHFFLVMLIYGIGIHFANTIEIFARVYLHITDGELYNQIYWVDEQLSHWIQFFFYFLFFAWLIIHDRLDRRQGASVAIFTGLLHGLERAIGVIEGDSPHTALVYGCVILVACYLRFQKHEQNFARVWQDFFFRHGLSFGISMPTAIFMYEWVFDGLKQPSTMGNQAWQVLVFVAIFALIGFGLSVILDRFLGFDKKQK
jgi:hypothetical protein